MQWAGKLEGGEGEEGVNKSLLRDGHYRLTLVRCVMTSVISSCLLLRSQRLNTRRTLLCAYIRVFMSVCLSVCLCVCVFFVLLSSSLAFVCNVSFLKERFGQSAGHFSVTGFILFSSVFWAHLHKFDNRCLVNCLCFDSVLRPLLQVLQTTFHLTFKVLLILLHNEKCLCLTYS